MCIPVDDAPDGLMLKSDRITQLEKYALSRFNIKNLSEFERELDKYCVLKLSLLEIHSILQSKVESKQMIENLTSNSNLTEITTTTATETGTTTTKSTTETGDVEVEKKNREIRQKLIKYMNNLHLIEQNILQLLVNDSSSTNNDTSIKINFSPQFHSSKESVEYLLYNYSLYLSELSNKLNINYTTLDLEKELIKIDNEKSKKDRVELFNRVITVVEVVWVCSMVGMILESFLK